MPGLSTAYIVSDGRYLSPIASGAGVFFALCVSQTLAKSCKICCNKEAEAVSDWLCLLSLSARGAWIEMRWRRLY
nr:MAG TPA: hypothetical protein [Caudoviricetes sp.]